MTKALLLAVCCATALRGIAGDLRAVPLYRYGIIADGIGSANLVAADITGDGRPEIVSCSNSSPFALEYRSGAYPQRWYGPSVSCTAVTAGDANGDGANDVIVVGSKGLFVFDPRGSGAARASVTLPAYPTNVAFGNADLDNAPEIVVVSVNATYVYDAATLQLQWTAQGHGGATVFIADVDGDARNEIITGDGSILDGGNQAYKWGYLGGFPQVAVGNVDADPKAEIVFTSSYSNTATVLNGDTMTTSTVSGFGTIMQLAVGDADGDGVNEVIAGNDQWGAISARRAADSSLAWSIPNPDHGCSALAVADVDGDGVREVLWGAGLTSSGRDVLFVGNAQTHTVEWDSTDLDGPVSVAAGDLDGDGRAEVVAVFGGSDSGYDGAILKIFDGATGAEKREIAVDSYRAYRVAVAQLDSDPALEIAVNVEGGIRVFDGVTGAVEWTSPNYVTGMVIANVDADPTNEIITVLDGKIAVLHGLTNIIQSSRVFSGYVLAAGDVTGDGLAEVIAATSSTLYVLSPTLTTVVELPVSSVAAAATTAAAGGRIAVLADWDRHLIVFDKTLTQQWTCEPVNYNQGYSSVAFATIGEQPRLLTADQIGVLRAMPLDGNTCPASDIRNLGVSVHNMVSADVTGDGRAELITSTSSAATVTLLASAESIRGDVNGDAVVAENDIDQLVDYLFGATAGLSPTADANADERLSGEDAFALIHAEFGGGSLPE